MLTRETHARIYQGELAAGKYEELNLLARQRSTSTEALILEAIRAYLKNDELMVSMNVELVPVNNCHVRCYLWLPYDTSSKVELMMKGKGTYIQGLVRTSLRRMQLKGHAQAQTSLDPSTVATSAPT
ncbi:MAG: hypothetical protein JRJ77_15870 [Deltaproteobacteria bacterium]|nr:hypothetical protein [Deltaproteobacteria bacterium]MBW2341567.1 hypothetical protein [Deltaproteobacteria bacterium]